MIGLFQKRRNTNSMYLIKNGRIHVGDGTVLDGCDILTEGRVIRNIAPDICCQEAEMIDASGCEIFPGFIDPHSSVGAMGMPSRYLDNQEKTDPLTPQLNVKYAIDPDEIDAQEFYKSGITAVGLTPGNANVMGGQIAVCKTAHMKLADRLVKEKAALKCSVTSEVKSVYGGRNQMPKTRMGAFWIFQEALRKAKAPEEQEKGKLICEIFEKGSMPAFVAAQTAGEIQGVLEMMKTEHTSLVLVDGYEFDRALEEIKRQNAGLILGNVSDCSQVTKHGMDLGKICDLNENGNLVAFTASNGGFSEGREVFLWTAIEVYRAGADAEEVVKMMTLNPAKMLGVSDRIGTLETGKDADLSIYTGHPVKTYAARVRTSMINGEVVF